MSERSDWVTTTHDWSHDVDHEHLAEVRHRLGRPDAAGGRRHLILEVLAYADDEARSRGEVGRASVTVHADGRVTVADDGRGTDTRRDGEGRVVRKPVMATRDVRFAEPSTAPRLPDGFPRRGMSTVAALSSELVHENHRADGAWSQTYRHGIPDADLTPLDQGPARGTSVTFRTDVTGPTRLTDHDLHAFASLVIELA